MGETNNTQSDINKILQILMNRWKFIVLFVLAALSLGLITRLVLPTTYKATTKFIVRSPMLYDRNHIFRQEWYQNKAAFGDEDDVDMILAYFHGDFYRIGLVDGLGLQKIYGAKAYTKLEKNLKMKRNDTRELELTYYDQNRERAAQVVEMTRNLLEQKYGAYFQSYNDNVKEILSQQMTLTATQLAKIDDSIARYRDDYGLHEYLSPSRTKQDNATSRAGNASNIDYLEHLKTLVTEKDKLAEDRARISSLLREYSMNDNDKIFKSFFVIQYASAAASSVYPMAIIYYGVIGVVSLILACFIAITGGVLRNTRAKAL